MRSSRYTSVLAVALSCFGGSAAAGLCEAPFMHDGGETSLAGSGAFQLGADLRFTEVKKSGSDCEARVQGVATYGLAGLPPGSSELDYWMIIKGGDARFERRDAQGNREPVEGKFDLRMLGLFAYGEPINRAGQTFPALRFQINVDRKAVQSAPIVVNTGEKTVGEMQAIDTASGRQRCWPIQYTRVIDPTQATFGGLVLPIPGMTASVTDWFCPDLNMVMKQESRQNGVASIVEVTKLR
jgi:hypothetical protein